MVLSILLEMVIKNNQFLNINITLEINLIVLMFHFQYTCYPFKKIFPSSILSMLFLYNLLANFESCTVAYSNSCSINPLESFLETNIPYPPSLGCTAPTLHTFPAWLLP